MSIKQDAKVDNVKEFIAKARYCRFNIAMPYLYQFIKNNEYENDPFSKVHDLLKFSNYIKNMLRACYEHLKLIEKSKLSECFCALQNIDASLTILKYFRKKLPSECSVNYKEVEFLDSLFRLYIDDIVTKYIKEEEQSCGLL